MRWFLLPLSITLGFIFFFQFSLTSVQAKEPAHRTVIINQVRGTECCEPGSVEALKGQLDTLKRLQLPATFVVRYDGLLNPEIVSLLKSARAEGFEIGALLELTPELVNDSQVEYRGNPETWHEAQNAYLIGYSPADRHRIIDAYMRRFKLLFDAYPQTTTAWMIDADSLTYLSNRYQVTTHQLTREQWGLDSYTLDGGPPHAPYLPSSLWPLVPQSFSGQSNSTQPLIMRQTIDDPVWAYGDRTSSYTSQPNDYILKKRDFAYFEHLFTQAHDQPTESSTFALIGLETSMSAEAQQEYLKQLEWVKTWTDVTPGAEVVTANTYTSWWKTSTPGISQLAVYHGLDQKNPQSQAWWITTPNYRVRIRLDNQELFISDVRLYSPQLTDPYLTIAAQRQGYWVVPFLLNGARFWENGPDIYQPPVQDFLADRAEKYGSPARWKLTQVEDGSTLSVSRENGTIILKQADQIQAIFHPDSFELPKTTEFKTNNAYLSSVVSTTDDFVRWLTPVDQPAWSLRIQPQTNGLKKFTPQLDASRLSSERQSRSHLLFPELSVKPLSVEKTELVVSNAYAIAGRNPVRLVFYPRDQVGYPTALEQEPKVTTEKSVDAVKVQRPEGNSGLYFIDLDSAQPQTTKVTVTSGEFIQTHQVTFAPSCYSMKVYCLTHPRQTWWFFQNWRADRQRAKEEAAKQVDPLN